jgi:hypothetical protein
MSLDEFQHDRNEALLSMNETCIRAFAKKYDLELPEHAGTQQATTLFWAAVHKSITAIPALPIEFRRQSKQWLSERNLQSEDDGEL